MSEKYQKLLEPLTLTNGAKINYRIAMAPMVAQGSNPDGTVSENDLDFYSERSNVAGIIITGAATVSERGKGFDKQLSISDDTYIAGLKKLAAVLKKDGNKAIIQLYHGGREAKSSYDKFGEVVAPSAVEFPFLSYTPRALTEEEIQDSIAAFGAATKRAIEAGFDGVEIHGANHYLLQQFFSAYSNQRDDFWGSALECRMNFPLAVVKEVKRMANEFAKPDFIVGYRYSPEEIHGDTIGYTAEESLQLIDKIVEHKLDYIHVSIFTKYNDKPSGNDKTFAELTKEVVGDRAAVIIVSNIFSADDALKALENADIAAIGRESLLEPKFAEKIAAGEADSILSRLTADRVDSLQFPEKLKDWFLEEGSALPPLPGDEYLKA
ncbi:NADH-dependent flavin oxidoreductase [Enterococcus sp. AZ072]|uniref:NADH-dependent flavin oxidoreductase n=1 Tax=unclassified Enterococcus TaxID=2608891 RepID=UPI003D26749E